MAKTDDGQPLRQPTPSPQGSAAQKMPAKPPSAEQGVKPQRPVRAKKRAPADQRGVADRGTGINLDRGTEPGDARLERLVDRLYKLGFTKVSVQRHDPATGATVWALSLFRPQWKRPVVGHTRVGFARLEWWASVWEATYRRQEVCPMVIVVRDVAHQLCKGDKHESQILPLHIDLDVIDSFKPSAPTLREPKPAPPPKAQAKPKAKPPAKPKAKPKAKPEPPPQAKPSPQPSPQPSAGPSSQPQSPAPESSQKAQGVEDDPKSRRPPPPAPPDMVRLRDRAEALDFVEQRTLAGVESTDEIPESIERFDETRQAIIKDMIGTLTKDSPDGDFADVIQQIEKQIRLPGSDPIAGQEALRQVAAWYAEKTKKAAATSPNVAGDEGPLSTAERIEFLQQMDPDRYLDLDGVPDGEVPELSARLVDPPGELRGLEPPLTATDRGTAH